MPLDELKKILHDLQTAKQEQKTQSEIQKLLSELLHNELKKFPVMRKGRFDVKDAKAFAQGKQTMPALDKALVTPTTDERIREFQKKCDDAYLAACLLNVPIEATQLYQEVVSSDFYKAMYEDTSGHYGSDWVPTNLSADLIRYIELELRVASLHRAIPMPTNPYKLPIQSGIIDAYLVAESTDATGNKAPDSGIPSSNVTLTASKLAARVLISEEITEDSIVPILPLVKQDIAKALSRAVEKATIDGQKSGVIDTGDAPGANDVRNAWDGYRYEAPSSAKVDFSSWSSSNGLSLLRALRAKMGKYGVKPGDLAYVVSIGGFNKLLSIDEVVTIDKYGPNATILTGELGKIDGIPIIVSEYVREDLDATGVYSGAGHTNTIVLLVNRPALMYGDKRKVTVKQDELIQTDQTVVVATMRKAFTNLYHGEPDVAIGYGLPL